MAFCTNRKNIKPVFGFIPQIMMIMLCRLKAQIALKCFDFGQSTSNYGAANSISRSCFFRVVNTIMSRSRTASNFALFRLLIMFSVSFSLILIRAIIITYFTITTFAGFFGAVFIKIRKRFNFFAFRTSLCYDWFRHGFFLYKKLCLEPFTGQSCVRLVLLYMIIKLNQDKF